MRALHDRVTGVTERVSVGSRRLQGDGPSEFHIAIARDGSFVVFSSTADNLVPNDTNDDWDSSCTRCRRRGSLPIISGRRISVRALP